MGLSTRASAPRFPGGMGTAGTDCCIIHAWLIVPNGLCDRQEMLRVFIQDEREETNFFFIFNMPDNSFRTAAAGL